MSEPAAAAELTIETLVGGGRGLAHHDGEVWMVAGALPGETVAATPERRRAGVVGAQAVSPPAVPHPAREPRPCRHAPSCGGCDWPHVEPAAGAALKTAVAAGAARAHPEVATAIAAAPVVPSPAAYRLRARLHFDPAAGRLGFYAPRSWQVSEISDCRIVSPTLARCRERLAAALDRCPEAVDVEWLEDLAGDRAVIALRGSRHHPEVPAAAWLPRQADLAGTAIVGCHRLDRAGTILPGWGDESVRMVLPIPLEVPVGAFFQCNRHLVPWLFGRVGELAEDTAEVWDLHAGVGLLAAAARHRGATRLTLAEPFRPAARAAVRNLPGARVAVGRTAEAMLGRRGRLPRDVAVVVDPPRTGLSAPLRHRLAGWHPARIVMLGCDPATWARDAASLLARGYRLASLELVDLFPSTHHVEILARLEAE